MTLHDRKTRDSYRYCRRLARRTGRNFYVSFYVLPKSRRLAMCALYAFMRKTDDLGDSDLPVEVRRRALADWRKQLDDALAGRLDESQVADPCWPALADAVSKYRVPPETLHAVIDGCESDLVVTRYEAFDDLYRYCYKVASAVGLACIRIWGADDPQADQPAEHCGVAFQLTNILRDIQEDSQRGRVYLPQEDLRRFGVEERDLEVGAKSVNLERLLRFQIERAETYYSNAEPIYRYLPPAGQAIQQAMTDIYHGLLQEIARDPAQVFQRRVSLSGARKFCYVARALPRRFFPRPRP